MKNCEQIEITDTYQLIPFGLKRESIIAADNSAKMTESEQTLRVYSLLCELFSQKRVPHVAICFVSQTQRKVLCPH